MGVPGDDERCSVGVHRVEHALVRRMRHPDEQVGAWSGLASHARVVVPLDVRVVDPDEIEGEVADFDPSVTTFVCLCSSDPVYEAQGADAARSLRDAGATTVYLAGRGVGLDGVDDEIGLGTDLLDTLSRTLDQMGVPS